MHGTLEVDLKAYLHLRHQHCTNEAQKAETVLSAVIYIYIYSKHLLIDPKKAIQPWNRDFFSTYHRKPKSNTSPRCCG